MDLVCRTEAMPRPGETILGGDFVTVPGGKGANQAVAAAKLSRRGRGGQGGREVYLVGRVGGDDFGERLLNGLRQHAVKTDFVTITEGVSSGIAMILVDKKGENSIVVAPGANAKLSERDVDRAREVIRKASCVIMQLEIPVATVKHAIAMCQRFGVYTILDPAPAPPPRRGGQGGRGLYGVDLLTPNQTEAEMLLGVEVSHQVRKKRLIDPKQLAGELLSRGAEAVVLKLGSRGAMVATADGFAAVKGFKAKVVDTTAAGDAFTGALAVARAEGVNLDEAVRFANAAGAICCEGFGAQPSLPDRAQVNRMMGVRGG
jgi:ribokinase